MYVSAGVGDVATVLPVVEHRVKSHYFLDKPYSTVLSELSKVQVTFTLNRPRKCREGIKV
jgi:hypothetical protein